MTSWAAPCVYGRPETTRTPKPVRSSGLMPISMKTGLSALIRSVSTRTPTTPATPSVCLIRDNSDRSMVLESVSEVPFWTTVMSALPTEMMAAADCSRPLLVTARVTTAMTAMATAAARAAERALRRQMLWTTNPAKVIWAGPSMGRLQGWMEVWPHWGRRLDTAGRPRRQVVADRIAPPGHDPSRGVIECVGARPPGNPLSALLSTAGPKVTSAGDPRVSRRAVDDLVGRPQTGEARDRESAVAPVATTPSFGRLTRFRVPHGNTIAVISTEEVRLRSGLHARDGCPAGLERRWSGDAYP